MQREYVSLLINNKEVPKKWGFSDDEISDSEMNSRRVIVVGMEGRKRPLKLLIGSCRLPLWVVMVGWWTGRQGVAPCASIDCDTQ